MASFRAIVASAAVACCSAAAATPAPQPLTTWSINTGGVFAALGGNAASAPNVSSPRSECGIGALMPWNDLLYFVTYLSVPDAGAGTGLYAIDQNMNIQQLATHSSVYANRMLHAPTNSIIIGPYVIDANGGIRVITDLLTVRLGGMAEHLITPDTHVYMLGMDGPLWEVDLTTLTATQLFNLTVTLNIPAALGEQPHFKAAHSSSGLLWIGTNTYEEADALGIQHGGRLATWNGSMSAPWTIVETTAFFEVTGRKNMGCTVFAAGWDRKSVILKVLDNGCDSVDPSYDTAIQTYRLPKASHTWDHLWTTEWPRIREVESERYIMDAHGMMFELAPFTYGGATWGIKPISQHLRMIPDFASYRGFLVLGGNQVSSIFDNNLITGQSQSGLVFMKTDDLWKFGKPAGWGGPWLYDNVIAGVPSDPYLMTGFGGKVVHFRVDPPTPGPVNIQIQIDFTGAAGHRGEYFYMEPWNTLTTIAVSPAANPYAIYVFPQGFSAHWVRFVTDTNCNCTAFLHYT